MTTPPFQNIRLAPGEKFDEAKQQQVFDAITRNFEDLYSKFQTQQASSESLANVFRALTNGNHKIAFGEQGLVWSASKASAKAEVAHGLGTTPKAVFLQIEDAAAPFVGGVSLDANLISRSATKIVFAGTCSEAISITFNCLWLAII